MAAPAHVSRRDEFFQSVYLLLLRFELFFLRLNLRLLFFDRVDEDDAQVIVFHAFDFTFIVARDEQRLNLCDIFST